MQKLTLDQNQIGQRCTLRKKGEASDIPRLPFCDVDMISVLLAASKINEAGTQRYICNNQIILTGRDKNEKSGRTSSGNHDKT
jgi:hypothetical protein